MDPEALLNWIYGNLSNRPEEVRHATAYKLLGSLLNNNLVPPAQEAS